MSDLAKILVYGDIHLSSKNYGAHINYPKESLDCFRQITTLVEKYGVTHLIGLGDFTYGRFNTLEYRVSVEQELAKQYELVSGNHYELRGNHDSAGYGMTEYEYYVSKGLLKPSTNLTIGNLHITMVDYGKHYKTEPNVIEGNNSVNIIFGHDYFKFDDTRLPNMGNFVILDGMQQWYGADYLISGHIHNQYSFEGLVTKDVGEGLYGHRMMVLYPGSLSRPSYREGLMDLTGQVILITIKNTLENPVDIEILDVELLPLEEVFNLNKKQIEKEKKIAKERRLDISDIIEQLNTHERNVGNPEDIILAMTGIDEKYKKKAIELLKLGMGS